MAKELPYFKFFCSEWNDGDITLESFHLQGVFINVCSYYWSNECDLKKDKLLKRFRGLEDELSELKKLGIIKEKSNHVFINFLDEQWKERLKKSAINSQSAKKRWSSERNANADANASKTQSESDANKKREEKKRKDNIKEDSRLIELRDNQIWYETKAMNLRWSFGFQKHQALVNEFWHSKNYDKIEKDIFHIQEHYINWINKKGDLIKPIEETPEEAYERKRKEADRL